jgi:hypothetical protein
MVDIPPFQIGFLRCSLAGVPYEDALVSPELDVSVKVGRPPPSCPHGEGERDR